MHLPIGILLTFLSLCLIPTAWADLELVAPDGRKVILMDNGTWKYLDTMDTGVGDSKEAKPEQAILQLEARTQFGPNCRIRLRLTNKLPYEIIQIVPYFSAFRDNGVMHQSLGLGFQSVRPADDKVRVVEFTGIQCSDIARIQVVGGDRCAMGELTKFTPDKGLCLGRIGVTPSTVMTFEK